MSSHAKDIKNGTVRKADKQPEWGTKTEHYDSEGRLKPKPKPKVPKKAPKKKAGIFDRLRQYGSGKR